MSAITIRDLLKAGAHFGHQTRYWSPSMAPYIFGARNKIHIINLDTTLSQYKEARNFIDTTVAQGGEIMFVGTKRQARKVIREQAQRSGSSYVDHRWLGGMLTNYKTVKNSINKLKNLEQRIDSGETQLLTKKEALTIEREKNKLEKTLSGIKDMRSLPDALFVVDVESEYIAVTEANKLGIPVVALVDTNCNVKGIDYVIPCNDDSAGAIKLLVTEIADTVLDARSRSRTVVAPEGDDEYIELDDQGQVIAPVVAAVDATEAPAQGEAEVEAKEVAESDSDTEQTTASKKKVAKKKVAKKKVTKKKVVRKKTTTASDEAE